MRTPAGVLKFLRRRTRKLFEHVSNLFVCVLYKKNSVQFKSHLKSAVGTFIYLTPFRPKQHTSMYTDLWHLNNITYLPVHENPTLNNESPDCMFYRTSKKNINLLSKTCKSNFWMLWPMRTGFFFDCRKAISFGRVHHTTLYHVNTNCSIHDNMLVSFLWSWRLHLWCCTEEWRSFRNYLHHRMPQIVLCHSFFLTS